MGSSVGTRYYYDKGSVRVHVKISPSDLVELKSLAIDEDTSVISIVSDATKWMISNTDKIPTDFPPPPDNAKSFHTYINREVHKELKKLSLILERPLCDVLGFMFAVWAKAGGKVD